MGKRLFFHGTMNASKSAQLLMQAFNLERQGKKLVVFKPAIDTRDLGIVKSRALDGGRQAILVHKNKDGFMFDCIKNHPDVDFIFVDELQFFTPEQVEELARISIELDKYIFAYGLLISYTGKMFEASKRAIECGFSLHEIKMQCDFCANKSTHHLLFIDGKLITDGDGIFVGDTEYKSVCYECYYKAINNRQG